MKNLLIILFAAAIFACNKNTDAPRRSVAEQIDALISVDKYEDALTLLAANNDHPDILKLKEIVHLNYGLFLEYRDSDETNMREKMNNALKQYIEVLKVNIANRKAIEEIDQIMSIYATIPDRKPAEEITAELKALGFEY